MKTTTYIALSVLLLLCGCSKRLFPNIEKTHKLQDTTTLTSIDTIAAENTLETTIQRISIPEEWTSIKDDSLVVLESMSGELDSLLNSWYADTYLLIDTTCTASNVNPIFSDTVYTERLANLPCIVPMVYNQPVRTHIDRYATKLRHQVSYMLGMMEYYEPLIEQALDVYNVPNELKYLPVIESALNPVAVSRVGATGL